MHELGYTNVDPADIQKETMELWKMKSKGIRFDTAKDLKGIHDLNANEFVVSASYSGTSLNFSFMETSFPCISMLPQNDFATHSPSSQNLSKEEGEDILDALNMELHEGKPLFHHYSTSSFLLEFTAPNTHTHTFTQSTGAPFDATFTAIYNTHKAYLTSSPCMRTMCPSEIVSYVPFSSTLDNHLLTSLTITCYATTCSAPKQATKDCMKGGGEVLLLWSSRTPSIQDSKHHQRVCVLWAVQKFPRPHKPA